MPAVWPAALPQVFLVAGYREQLPDPVIRTQMDAGPPKTRRRYTAAFRPIQGRLYCTAAELATLENFHQAVCAGGSLPFDWVNSRTGAVQTFQWRAAPLIEPEHRDGYWVQLDLWQVP